MKIKAKELALKMGSFRVSVYIAQDGWKDLSRDIA